MNTVFAPGCALYLYKPELIEKVMTLLKIDNPDISVYSTCCQHEPSCEPETHIINVCAGCDRRYREEHETVTTISLWEILDQQTDFIFPDYAGQTMTILDTCPIRNHLPVQNAVRSLIQKMNIQLIEPEKTGPKGTCCGDRFHGKLPIEKVKDQMEKRASEMPTDKVVVYCVSCIKSMAIGGKQPQHIIDLLFGEPTIPGETDPDIWHDLLNEFIKTH